MAPGYELGSDIDDCTARCARLPWCVGVSFDPARSRCYHATATTPSRSAPHSSSLSMLCPLAPSGEELPPENETWSYTAGQGSNGVDAAARAAAAAEVTVLSVATQSAEGNDRASLSLGRRQETLIHAVLAAAPGRVVVVVRAPGAVSMPWAANITAARAIILQLMPGQAAGTALAAILFGDIEPTGRLPITFPYTMAQSWLENSTSRFPGVNDSVIWAGDPDARAHPSQDVQATYSEGLYMGYRYYGIALSADRNEDGDDAYRGKLKAPLWPFGHGLGFNEWTWNDLRVVGVVSELSNATVYVTLSNYYGMTASRCDSTCGSDCVWGHSIGTSG